MSDNRRESGPVEESAMFGGYLRLVSHTGGLLASAQTNMSQPQADLASEIEARARSACTISLFLDFDGTLVPISGIRRCPS